MLSIKMDRDFCKRIYSLTWSDIYYGLSKGWINPEIAVDFALRELKNPDCSSDIVELAGMSFDDEYAIRDKLSIVQPKNVEADKVKWMNLILAWLYENQAAFHDPLLLVEETYAEFDYSESIQHLVRYMPVDGQPRNLMNDWKSYLDEHVYSAVLQRKS